MLCTLGTEFEQSMHKADSNAHMYEMDNTYSCAQNKPTFTLIMKQIKVQSTTQKQF